MKKYSLFLVVIALMSIVCSVFSEETVSFDTQKVTVEDYAGVWHMKSLCSDEGCLPFAVHGDKYLKTEMILKEDFSASVSKSPFFDGKAQVLRWKFDDGTASVTMVSFKTGKIEEAPLVIDDDGVLNVGSDGATLKFTRNENIFWGTGDVKEDAVIEDFLGEWSMFSYWVGEKYQVLPLFNIEGGMVVNEDGRFDLDLYGEMIENVEYTFADGKMSGEYFRPSSNSLTEFTVRYHTENALAMSLTGPDDGKKDSKIVFIRPNEMPEITIFDLTAMHGIMDKANN